MKTETPETYIAFAGTQRIAGGELAKVVRKVKAAFDQDSGTTLMIFDRTTSRRLEIDLGGSVEEVLQRIPRPRDQERVQDSRGPGRPRLGVVAREVTLLPRHWEWLNAQPGGASVALRKLVEEARRTSLPRDRARESQESVYRFMSAVAGDLPGYEEVLRTLYRGESEQFMKLVKLWPKDVREHITSLAETAFADMKASEDSR